jgi:hypothetical protein
MPKYKLQEDIKTTKDKQRENNVQVQAAERDKDKQHDKYRIRPAEHRHES